MRINQNKLEVKYALDIYKEIPGFPSHTDITYVMIRALEDTNLVGEEFLPENIWHHMKTCMATMQDLRAFLDTNTSLCEKTRADKKGSYYKLINNPWS